MKTNHPDRNEHSIANYAALKTAIVNGELENVKALLANQPMQSLEKNYLIDLAKLTNNHAIIEHLKEVSEKN